MSGPPGSGKTLLAKALPSILPKMTLAESLEVTRIYSTAGLLPADQPLITSRPFRSPHHSSSGVALVGGGAWPRPGEISLSHRGVLFLDEFFGISQTGSGKLAPAARGRHGLHLARHRHAALSRQIHPGGRR